MKLTQHADYGIRILTYLGLHPQSQATVGEIAAAFDISHHHLTKVVQQLVAQGVVESRRGKQGGLRLARSPHEIRVGSVIRALENDFHLVECMRHERDCKIAPVCRFSDMVTEASEAFLAVLDGYTLDDMLFGSARRRQLNRLLILEPRVAERH
ncbi:RrF2 family transcriptional regulator [Wenzhouxiangella limi]|uniref:Rrf2 family transcriptional regulator n=1 Tax=Wenzhouxiangella limi TaxID=2707351 RepID=A0A845V2L5_9GAMM|nr:Rrf2 family transcriptional regulator [Wenzhouxiangella limi]NDY96852.1 Rrf2 family transcriptional regulator [Wenzhouxiangella limi]